MTYIIDFFRYNPLKKLIALVAAFFMWVYVMADQDPAIEDSYTVPLTISNTPYEFITLCNERNITVFTRAPRSNFVKYNANAFRAYVNVEGLGEGEHQITPKVDMPQGFELVKTQPEVVAVKLDPLTERQMPVELIMSGTVAPDSAVKDMQKSMDIVTIVGPKSFVEQITKVYGLVNFSGNSSSFEVQIPMNAVDKDGNSLPRVHVVPSVITVSVDVESGVKKKIVPIIPDLHPAQGWSLTKVTIEPEQMEISGAEAVVNSIVTLKTLPFNVQTGQRLFKGTLKLDIPEGITVKNDEVTVSAEVVRNPVTRDQTP